MLINVYKSRLMLINKKLKLCDVTSLLLVHHLGRYTRFGRRVHVNCESESCDSHSLGKYHPSVLYPS